MSYTKCVYHKCGNVSRDISMFRFPIHDPGRLVLWIRNSGNIYLDSLTNEELRCRYICAAHFLPSDIHTGIRSRLIGPAIPRHFAQVGEGTPVQSNECTDANIEDDIMISPEVLKVKTPTKFYVKKKNTEKISSSSSSLSMLEAPSLPETPTQRMSRKCLFDGPKQRLSRKCLFEQKEEDTPKTKYLKRNASALLKRNEAQRSLINRLRVKCKKEPNIIKTHDNFRSEISKTLALMQLRKKNDKKKWSEEEKNLCLSLFYKSSSTYEFLRRQGVVLAAPSTIRLWLAKSNCVPGLCSDIFKQIRKRFENMSLKEKACVVSFDEMSIMTNLEYSKKYDYIEGFEDLGGGHRSKKMAKNALVFVVRGLYSRWKFPIAYFLSATNVKANYLELLLKAVINKLFDHGLLPKVVVCDQATTNQNVLKKLGVSIENPFFFCNGRKIFSIYDVPHLIKSIRNNFIKNDFCKNNDQMSFQDIVKTYEIDKNSKISRSLPKLTDRHINPNAFQKMTVSLATQLFSNSVAAAIKTAKATGQLKSDTADSTANFIKLVNNMFDALNSRQQYDRNPYKHAVSRKSSLTLKAITDAKKEFLNLYKICYKTNKDKIQKKVLTRPPCFDGVIQTCAAVLQLFTEESSDSSRCYLITQKLNQDVIENLFARFRQKCGKNKNPTSKLLRAIFRSNLVNSLIKLPATKNCEDEDDNFIQLTVGDSNDSMQLEIQGCVVPEKSSPNRNVLGDAISSNKESATTIASTSGTENFTLEECSLAYFAGYLANSCLSKFHCEKCRIYLLKDVDCNDKEQLLILNKSYDCSKNVKLKMPSDGLLKLIHIAVDQFNKLFLNIVHSTKIKSRLNKTILDFLRSDAPQVLNISCEEHIKYIINQMILVKIHFYCKNKTKLSENKTSHPKLRILKNK